MSGAERILPPVIHTSEPNSWARHTFETRIPRILDDLRAANDYPPPIAAALRDLRTEIVGGTIQPLRENAPDREFWDAHAREHIGKTWLDVPWYWAEAFFYRRVLEATHYFQPGAFFQRDPFAPLKRAELAPSRAPRALARVLARLPDDANAVHALLHASLWGNRADLSMYDIAANPDVAALERERANLLVDDTARVLAHLQTHRGGQIDFICDNAGTELAFDLALADVLLRTEFARHIVLHLKPQPFFVSDATKRDVTEMLDALGQADAPTLRQFACRLAQSLDAGRIVLSDHPFWVTGFFFHNLPDDLRTILARAALVIVKGDANYRRLVGDCHWAPTTPFDSVVAPLPAPVVALRTLKAELIVGMRAGDAARWRAEDAAWMTNGTRGVVQFSPFAQSSNPQ